MHAHVCRKESRDLLISRCKNLSGTWRELSRNGPPPCRPFVEQILVVSQCNCCKLYKRHGVCSSGSVQLAHAELIWHSMTVCVCVCTCTRERESTQTVHLDFTHGREDKAIKRSQFSGVLESTAPLSAKTKLLLYIQLLSICYCVRAPVRAASMRPFKELNASWWGLSMWIWSSSRWLVWGRDNSQTWPRWNTLLFISCFTVASKIISPNCQTTRSCAVFLWAERKE